VVAAAINPSRHPAPAKTVNSDKGLHAQAQIPQLIAKINYPRLYQVAEITRNSVDQCAQKQLILPLRIAHTLTTLPGPSAATIG
jgi:hypothetical protein